MFLAGATGVLGRRIVPLLAADGQDVVALVRVPRRGHDVVELERHGVEVVEGNAEFRLAQRIPDAGIFLHPREEHGRLGWFRMVYTQDQRVVAEGLNRFVLTLSSDLFEDNQKLTLLHWKHANRTLPRANKWLYNPAPQKWYLMICLASV